MPKTDIFCFYGFSTSDYRKERLSAIDVSKTVSEFQGMLCRFSFVLFCCPSLDCCWIKDYSTLGVKSFQKFKGVSVLFDDYPFLRSLYEETN